MMKKNSLFLLAAVLSMNAAVFAGGDDEGTEEQKLNSATVDSCDPKSITTDHLIVSADDESVETEAQVG